MILETFKDDIKASLKIWKDLLQEMQAVDYAYVKGSAIKQWESLIDYVPFVSDIDLHVKFASPQNFFDTMPDPAISMLSTASTYQKRFETEFPDALHIPRIQLIILTEERERDFIPPIVSQIHPLIGEPVIKPFPANEVVRSIDRYNLESDWEYVSTKLPETVVDRIGIEFWTVIRRLNWRVSPTPIRLLTQLTREEPALMWTLNRTKVVEHLEELELHDLAKHYSQFYLHGWQLYESNFQSIELMKQMITDAYYCIKEAKLVYDAHRKY